MATASAGFYPKSSATKQTLKRWAIVSGAPQINSFRFGVFGKREYTDHMLGSVEVGAASMALPQASEARGRITQAAKQRCGDARFLLEAERTGYAIYLAGYCVECILKALILSMVPQGKRTELLGSFRGSKAHDFDWLKTRYFENGGPQFPKAVSKAFSFVNTWAVEIRDKAGTSRYGDAKAFLDSAEEIMTWADGRM